MSLINKLLIAVGFILATVALSLFIYNQVQKSKSQLAIEAQIVEQKELLNKIVRSQSEYASKKDVEDYVKQNGIALKAIQDDLKKLSADVNAVSVIIFGSSAQKGTDIATTSTGPRNPSPSLPPTKCKDGTVCPDSDPYGFDKVQQNLELTENFSEVQVPLGSVGFSAWKPKPWSLDIKAREYSVSSVIGRDENERLYFYNTVSVTVDGKAYTLPIKKAITKEEYPEPKWSWWNPRLFVGIDGGAKINPVSGEFTPSLDVGVFSYGRYKKQPDFSFAQIGLGVGLVSQKPQFVITPATYNVGQHIPLMNNMYLGPSVHVSPDGGVGVMLGARVAL